MKIKLKEKERELLFIPEEAIDYYQIGKLSKILHPSRVIFTTEHTKDNLASITIEKFIVSQNALLTYLLNSKRLIEVY
jgi:hypothetical protein